MVRRPRLPTEPGAVVVYRAPTKMPKEGTGAHSENALDIPADTYAEIREYIFAGYSPDEARQLAADVPRRSRVPTKPRVVVAEVGAESPEELARGDAAEASRLASILTDGVPPIWLEHGFTAALGWVSIWANGEGIAPTRPELRKRLKKLAGAVDTILSGFNDIPASSLLFLEAKGNATIPQFINKQHELSDLLGWYRSSIDAANKELRRGRGRDTRNRELDGLSLRDLVAVFVAGFWQLMFAAPLPVTNRRAIQVCAGMMARATRLPASSPVPTGWTPNLRAALKYLSESGPDGNTVAHGILRKARNARDLEAAAINRQ